MTVRGAKPTPTTLKVLHGTLRKHRTNPNEPRVLVEIPTCPRELSPTAKKEWRRIAPLLAGMGLIAHLDRAALSMYCDHYGRWLEAIAALQKYGVVIKSPSGFPCKAHTSPSRTSPASRCGCCLRSSACRHRVARASTLSRRQRLRTMRSSAGSDGEGSKR